MKNIVLLSLLVSLSLMVTACSKNVGLPIVPPIPLTSTPTIGATSTPTATSTPWVSTFAGLVGVGGSADGPVNSATFAQPKGVAVDAAGNVYVSDVTNHNIRKITQAGVVSTVAGSAGVIGSANGTGTAATFNYPFGLAVDSSDNVYVADTNNQLIRKITSGGVVSTLAGSVGVIGSANGTGTAAAFNYPTDMAVDASGNIFVTDQNNDLIRKITPGGVVSTFAGSGSAGTANGIGTAASFNFPRSIAVDSSNNLFVADNGSGLIREITSGGVVTTIASGAGTFYTPNGVTVDNAGNLYVTDMFFSVWKITNGVVSLYAGQQTSGGSANGPTASSSFSLIWGVAADSSGDVYVADSSNQEVREIHP